MKTGILVRKLIHVSSLVFVVLPLKLSNVGLVIIGTLYTLSEILRLYGIKFPIVYDITMFCAYPSEKKKFMKRPLLLILAYLILLNFFSPQAYLSGLLTTTISDSVAAIIGLMIGKRKIYKNKTLEGFSVMFLSSFTIIVSLTQNGWFALFASIVAAVFELLSGEWDNFLVPVSVAVVVEAFRIV
ncbi:MAG: hypothetical protein J7K98_01000 [Candidatus Aenigmarchaeota archaeon]|nr:hypothetical protein [Candidatus Aenigmarchaeota archaeon]